MAPLPPAGGERVWAWRQSAQIDLGPGLGRLTLTPEAEGPIALARLPARLTLRWRMGGERIQPRASAPRRALKDLLREAAVVPWQRSRMPLIYALCSRVRRAPPPSFGIGTAADGGLRVA